MPHSISWRSRVHRWLHGQGFDSPRYTLTRWLFLRLLGMIYLSAFGSLWGQIHGLIGSAGLLPAAEFLNHVHRSLGSAAYWRFPTLAWLSAADTSLSFLCMGGIILALLLMLDVYPLLAAGGAWLFYLSLVNIGQDFLLFQWDALLLETGFLAIFFAPAHALPGRTPQTPPSRTVLWLLRWLLFRLMFLSGVVKLTSGDPTWRNLTALAFHYETQPLPSPLAWYLHQLPLTFHQLSTAWVLVVELLAPFLIFAPRRIRFVAAGFLIALQLFILLTGNYTFFNLLTIVLCIVLFDDAVLQRVLPRRIQRLAQGPAPAKPTPVYRRWFTGLLAFTILLLTGTSLVPLIAPSVRAPGAVYQLARRLAPFHIVNSYGLFAVMTTERPEILVEGSMDGQTWVAYRFQAKPGDVHRAPRWIAPYHPRLDWQMWFAALSGADNTSWFNTFMLRLLQGSPDVLSLLDGNPFPEQPPRYVRATLYDYSFTDFEMARENSGAWWQARQEGVYFPVISLESIQELPPWSVPGSLRP